MRALVIAAMLSMAAPVAHARPMSDPTRLHHELPAAATPPISRAMDAYERIGDTLSQGSLVDVHASARALASSLEEALALLAPRGTNALRLSRALAAAERLSASTHLEDAREQYARLSESLVRVARDEPTLREGRALYTCPRARGSGTWFQSSGQARNPYGAPGSSLCAEPASWESGDAEKPS